MTIRREYGVLGLSVVIYVIVALIEPRFFSLTSLTNVMLFFPFLLLVSLGEMIEVVSRNIDVSVGAVLGFAAVVVGMIYRTSTLPLPLAFLIAIAVGMTLGLINGLLVTWMGLPSVIVTLGTMFLFRGLMFITMGAVQIDNTFIPRSLVQMSQAQHSVIGIPYTVLIALAAVALASVFLRKTRLGREIYAVGNNPEAARLRGVSVDQIRIIVFVISGFMAGLGAMVYISRIGYINPVIAGVGLEFTAIAAVVIGGTSMRGGVGTALGTLFGCVLLGVINTAIPILGISGFWREAVYGLIVIIAIVLDRYYQVRITRRVVRAGALRTAGSQDG